jgi:hypothetical protein
MKKDRRKEMLGVLESKDAKHVPVRYHQFVKKQPNPNKGEEEIVWQMDLIKKLDSKHIRELLSLYERDEIERIKREATKVADVEEELFSRNTVNLEIRYKPGNIVNVFASDSGYCLSIVSFDLVHKTLKRLHESNKIKAVKIMNENRVANEGEILSLTDMRKLEAAMECVDKWKNEIIEDFRLQVKEAYDKAKKDKEPSTSNIITASPMSIVKKPKKK